MMGFLGFLAVASLILGGVLLYGAHVVLPTSLFWGLVLLALAIGCVILTLSFCADMDDLDRYS